MALRTGHGTGAGVPRIEVLPPDELPSASPPVAVREDRAHDGRFVRGNTAQALKLVRPGPRGAADLDNTHPEFMSFQRWGRKFASHRRAELARAHGGSISAGVGALIESESLAMAASRFVYWKASLSGDPELFKRASALANDARQNELAAWELASREAAARPQGAYDPLAAFQK